jgi:DNA repair protein RecN (Recombination protein N)
VIRSIDIRDLVVIAEAALEPAPGLTAITGESGAGKTVLAQALELLAGAPASAATVRPGARHAIVEAALSLPEGFWDDLDEDDPARPLRELAEDETEVVIARRVPAEGRARALVEGATASREGVAAIARAAMRFSGQHEHRRLVGPAAQLEALDAFAGQEAVDHAAALARARRELAALDRRVAELRGRRAAAEREREELELLVGAVDAARLDLDEEAALRAERARLMHAEQLAEGAAGAAERTSPESGEGGALGLVGEALRDLEPLAALDAGLAGPSEDLRSAQAALQEVARALRGYLDGLDAEPGRLQQVEERLEAYSRLQRVHGSSTAEVLERAEAARARLVELGPAGDEAGVLAARRRALLGEARELAGRLAALRAGAAPRLEEAVTAELGDLAMGDARLRVELQEGEGDPPPQVCRLWLRANPGLPEAPLADAASGGELSRVLLALHGVAAARGAETWVFDEVDAGIGGVTAAAVGRRLAAMAATRQVIVITHLPQVAALADRHYRLAKDTDPAGIATTRIEPVEGDALVAELCRMLGAGPGDAGARRHAEELLARRG